MSAQKHVCVIGGGPGGYPAAFFAADRGMKVTLIDAASAPGGVCLYKGCIPSKTMLHAAKLIHEAQDGAKWGIHFEPPRIDLEALAAHSKSVITKLTQGLGGLAKRRDIRFIQGRGRVLNPQRVSVTRADGEVEEIGCDYIIVSTGSTPAMIPGFPTHSPRLMTSTEALQVEEIPERLLVVGGGYIGLELGTVYAALGSAVTVVEASPRLLNGADRDLVEQAEPRLRRIFDEVLLNTKVAEVVDRGEHLEARLIGLDVAEPIHAFDKILVAVGRRPRSAGIGLEETRVEIDDRGWIKTDLQRRTAEPTIFAIGDVAGEPMLAHKATYEARIAVEAIDGEATAYEPAAIPAVVFTDPEVAWCGLTEAEAKEKGIPHKVTRFPWGASGRAATLGRNDGLTKLILEPTTERVLGVGICGVGAGELIAEGVLAVEMGALSEDLQMVIHAHPTLSETMMEAAEMSHGGASAHYLAKGR